MTSNRPSARLTLLPHEVSFLLQIPRQDVISLLQTGELCDVSRDSWMRVGFEDALALIRLRTRERRCSPLAELLLERMRDGRLRVGRSEAASLSLEAALDRSDLAGDRH